MSAATAVITRTLQSVAASGTETASSTATTDAFEDVDYEVLGNLAFCIPIGFILIFTFSTLRRPFLRFYASNSKVFPFRKPLFPPATKNRFEWLPMLLRIPEGEALCKAGLDVFGLLQAFKMMFLLTSALLIPAGLILMPYYASRSDTSDGFFKFSTFNIANVYSANVWVPLSVALIATLICLHFMRVYLGGFIKARQHFLQKPSYGTAFRLLRELTEGLGDLAAGRDFVDISNRAVLVTSIPSGFDYRQLQAILERSSGGGRVERLLSIKQERVEQLQTAIEERQAAIEQLEKKLIHFNAKLKQEQEPLAADEEKRVPLHERTELILRLLKTDPELNAAYHTCLKHDEETQDALNAFNTLLVKQDQQEAESNPLLEHCDSLLTMRPDVHLRQLKGLQSFTGGESVLAVMDSDRSARTVSQVLLSGNPFALQTQPAPPPNDLIWENAAISEAERESRKQMGRIYYFLLHLAYAPISILITNISDMKKVARNFPSFNTFANSHPIARVVIQGIVCPLMLMMLMNFMVPIISAITRNEGHFSETEVQLRVLDRYSTFILVQTTLVGVLFSSLFEAYEVYLTQKFPGLISLAGKLHPTKAHFFANVLLQACFIDLCLELLRPGYLIYTSIADRFRLVGPDFVHENVRKERRSWKPLELEFGEIVAEAIIFPFQVFMSYYLINPLCILPALAYFAVAFVVYKYNILYVYSAEWESGGRMWAKIAKQMTVGIVLMQFFGAVQFLYLSSRPGLPLALMAAMIAGTILYVRSLLAQVRRYETFTGSWFEGDRSRALMAQKQQELLAAFPPVDTFTVANARLQAETAAKALNPNELPKRSYEVVPFDLESAQAFADEFDLDSTVDTMHAKCAYSNPFCLEHTQVIYLPAKLPARLRKKFSLSQEN